MSALLKRRRRERAAAAAAAKHDTTPVEVVSAQPTLPSADVVNVDEAARLKTAGEKKAKWRARIAQIAATEERIAAAAEDQ